MLSRSETRNLVLFFLTAFAWSWLLWLVPAFQGVGFLAPFGPSIAAYSTSCQRHR